MELGKISVQKEPKIKMRLDEYLESYKKSHAEIVEEVQEKFKPITEEESIEKAIRRRKIGGKAARGIRWDMDEEIYQPRPEYSYF